MVEPTPLPDDVGDPPVGEATARGSTSSNPLRRIRRRKMANSEEDGNGTPKNAEDAIGASPNTLAAPSTLPTRGSKLLQRVLPKRNTQSSTPPSQSIQPIQPVQPVQPAILVDDGSSQTGDNSDTHSASYSPSAASASHPASSLGASAQAAYTSPQDTNPASSISVSPGSLPGGAIAPATGSGVQEHPTTTVDEESDSIDSDDSAESSGRHRKYGLKRDDLDMELRDNEKRRQQAEDRFKRAVEQLTSSGRPEPSSHSIQRFNISRDPMMREYQHARHQLEKRTKKLEKLRKEMDEVQKQLDSRRTKPTATELIGAKMNIVKRSSVVVSMCFDWGLHSLRAAGRGDDVGSEAGGDNTTPVNPERGRSRTKREEKITGRHRSASPERENATEGKDESIEALNGYTGSPGRGTAQVDDFPPDEGTPRFLRSRRSQKSLPPELRDQIEDRRPNRLKRLINMSNPLTPRKNKDKQSSGADVEPEAGQSFGSSPMASVSQPVALDMQNGLQHTATAELIQHIKSILLEDPRLDLENKFDVLQQLQSYVFTLEERLAAQQQRNLELETALSNTQEQLQKRQSTLAMLDKQRTNNQSALLEMINDFHADFVEKLDRHERRFGEARTTLDTIHSDVERQMVTMRDIQTRANDFLQELQMKAEHLETELSTGFWVNLHENFSETFQSLTGRQGSAPRILIFGAGSHADSPATTERLCRPRQGPGYSLAVLVLTTSKEGTENGNTTEKGGHDDNGHSIGDGHGAGDSEAAKVKGAPQMMSCSGASGEGKRKRKRKREREREKENKHKNKKINATQQLEFNVQCMRRLTKREVNKRKRELLLLSKSSLSHTQTLSLSLSLSSNTHTFQEEVKVRPESHINMGEGQSSNSSSNSSNSSIGGGGGIIGWRKRGVLWKKAQGTSLLGRDNFKRRTFILTDTCLSYYSGVDISEMKQKGQIPLTKIRAVEVAHATPWGRSNMIQVVHDDAILYVDAESQAERQDWIDEIRSACQEGQNVSSKHYNYHPGVFHKGEWTCCATKEQGGGCKPAFKYSHKSKAPINLSDAKDRTTVAYFYDRHYEDDDLDPDEMSDAMLADMPTSHSGAAPYGGTAVPRAQSIAGQYEIMNQDFQDLDVAMFQPKAADGSTAKPLLESHYTSVPNADDDPSYAALGARSIASSEEYEGWHVRAREASTYHPASIASNYSQASIYSTLDGVNKQYSKVTKPGHESHYARLERGWLLSLLVLCIPRVISWQRIKVERGKFNQSCHLSQPARQQETAKEMSWVSRRMVSSPRKQQPAETRPNPRPPTPQHDSQPRRRRGREKEKGTNPAFQAQ
ncbi:uncharacterized protein MONBRDRAFT_24955 [Monosiga brevicollis MX1]|uniref:PH domain-containing protein n=1 Tax=Monosiga brevicollis TaxID=81824 RepID=A9UY87_MONBE|nr:uncharacterized protein MONBRDRAFT_24955 [Monosiga brevicollis MX1]EDQ89981.1 predicted protein [Monosiga brevicollis MX1]|eukprot:XP_001745403.1 hypothetical protein [Monosiga brevicollis MX1]